MPRQVLFDDIDATAELPQFDLRVLSAHLERIAAGEPNPLNAALNSPIGPSAGSEQEVEAEPRTLTLQASDNWQINDRIAELDDLVAMLQVQATEQDKRYARLMVRLEALHKVLMARDQRVAELEQQVRQQGEKETKLKVNLNQAVLQRQQHEQLILKQAQEIRRLREVAL